ncbi:MAG: inorganic pyrophosphatase [Actinomycetota bacterium]
MTPHSPNRAHPWHGVPAGPEAPVFVTAYVEITPLDTVKYELDKDSGLLKVDRVQLTSSAPPTLYGFIPRTYCGDEVAALTPTSMIADGDPLDICVFSERPIDRADVLLTARVVGGLRMIDGGEVDDKIVAVVKGDPVWAETRELSDFPTKLTERLEHYFLTYKLVPGQPHEVTIEERYGREHAYRVIEAAITDYRTTFGT